MSERTEMKCIRCGCFSSCQICWHCSNLPDAVDFGRIQQLEAELSELQKVYDFANAEGLHLEEKLSAATRQTELVEKMRKGWQVANSPGGWIDELRQRVEQAERESTQRLEALLAAQERVRELEKALQNSLIIGLAFIGYAFPDHPVRDNYVRQAEAKLRAIEREALSEQQMPVSVRSPVWIRRTSLIRCPDR